MARAGYMQNAIAMVALLSIGLVAGCATSQSSDEAPGKTLLDLFDANPGSAQNAGMCVGATFNRRDAYPDGSPEDAAMLNLGAYWTMQVTDLEKDPGKQLSTMMSAGRLLEQVEAISPEYHVTDEILRRCVAAKEGKV